MSKYRLYETMDDMCSLSVPYLFVGAERYFVSLYGQALNIALYFSIDNRGKKYFADCLLVVP